MASRTLCLGRRRFNHFLASALKDANFLLQSRTEFVSLRLKVEARLQIEPETFGRAEIPGKPKRGIG